MKKLNQNNKEIQNIKLVKKLLMPILSVSIMLLLVGCGDDVIEDVAEAFTNNDAGISYINGVDEQVNFFAKNSTSTKSLYNDDYKVTSLMSKEKSNDIRHKWLGLTESQFAIENSNNRSERQSISKKLKNNQGYWLIAWQENYIHQLSLLQKSSSDHDGQYRVRIFSNQKLNVYINGSPKILLTTRVAEASDWLTVEHCRGLIVGDNEIDLCQTGNLGKSYLAVINQDGLISLAEE